MRNQKQSGQVIISAQKLQDRVDSEYARLDKMEKNPGQMDFPLHQRITGCISAWEELLLWWKQEEEDEEKITCSSVGCELVVVGGCDKTSCYKLLPHKKQLIATAIKTLINEKRFDYEDIFQIFPDVTEGFIMAILNEGD